MDTKAEEVVHTLRSHGPHAVELRRVFRDGSWCQVRTAWRTSGAVAVYGTVAEWTSEHPAEIHLLTRGEAARWSTLRDPRRRQGFLASRLLLRSLLGELLGVHWTVLQPDRTALGAPYLPGNPELQLSLSHTGGLLVAAASRRGAIGVDTESAERPMAGTESRICTAYELQALLPCPEAERERQLLRLWTLKEAYTKALGQGLRVPLRSFGFSLADAEAFLLDVRGRSADAAYAWSLTTHTVRAGLPAPHLVSVAAQDSAAQRQRVHGVS